jgi:hypothetical protein
LADKIKAMITISKLKCEASILHPFYSGESIHNILQAERSSSIRNVKHIGSLRNRC